MSRRTLLEKYLVGACLLGIFTEGALLALWFHASVLVNVMMALGGIVLICLLVSICVIVVRYLMRQGDKKTK